MYLFKLKGIYEIILVDYDSVVKQLFNCRFIGS